MSDWYKELVGECKAIITEAVYVSRSSLVEGYWRLGQRIREDENIKEFSKGNKTFVQDLGHNIGVSTSTLYYSLQAYDKYPRMDLLPEGKNLSWNKLITKYLPRPKNNTPLPEGYTQPKTANIVHADFTKYDISDNSVDLIITDPPYPGEFLPLWKELGEFAYKSLKPSKFLVCYSGEIHLNEVFELLKPSGLIYYWTFCLYHQGKTQLVMPRNIICRWKPVLIFQKPPYKKLDHVIQDYVISEQPEKSDHDWQQSESGVTTLIENFSQEGDLIVDPFSGAGTFPLVAHKLGRRAIGIEKDEETYKSSLSRIYEQVGENKQA